jgi:hypothetical protein
MTRKTRKTPKLFVSLCTLALASFALLIPPPAIYSQAAPPSTKLPALKKIAAKPSVAVNYGRIPLSFEINQGQADKSIQFLSRERGYGLALQPGEALFTLSNGHAVTKGSPADAESPATLVRMQLSGADSTSTASGEDLQITRTNYFIGKDPSHWHTDIPNYGRVHYRNIYPGIDLVYYGNQRQLEHDFIVSPNANASQITFTLSGATNISVDPKSGDLLVAANSGTLRFLKPVTYQSIRNQRVEIPSSYKLLANNQVSFSLGTYDHSQPLVIDPILTYSTYLGGNDDDFALGIAADAEGNAYVTGYTDSTNYPTHNGFERNANGCACAFVSKVNATGSALIYSTYLGPTSFGYGIAIDSSGSAYVTGMTQSSGYPTVNAFQTTLHGLQDAFVTKLSPSGSSLVFSTYLGGSGSETANAIALDSNNNAYVAGITYSADFPTASPIQSQTKDQPGGNAFISKLSADGSALSYSTYLGGTGVYCEACSSFRGDSANGIAVDASGNAYVTGYTYSTDFPVKNPFEGPNYSKQQASTAFVSKINPSGSTLVYSTYLGGGGYDSASAITIDALGSAYVAGSTNSADFPIVNAYQSSYGPSFSTNGFVSKFNPAGSGLVYSTYLGGNGAHDYYYVDEQIYGVAVDANGSAYVTGLTTSTNFPVTSDAYQSTLTGLYSAFLTKFSPGGSILDYSTYLGGSGTAVHEQTIGYALAVSASGKAILAGSTTSTDFPITSGAFLDVYQGGNWDGFVTTFDFSTSILTTTSITESPNPQQPKAPVTFTAVVTASSGTDTPTGSVQFKMDGTTVGTVALDSSAQASFTTSFPTLGAHTAQAQYLGSPTFEPSLSSPLTEIISTAGIYPVSGGYTSAPGGNTVVPYGSTYANPIVAIVKDGAGNPVAGKTVIFSGTGLSFVPVSTVTGPNGLAQSIVTAHQVGALAATASVTGGDNVAVFLLYAEKATLRVQPETIGAIYGHPIPTPTVYSISGFVNGDTQASAITGTPVFHDTATSSSPVGQYPLTLTQGTLASINYNFLFFPYTVQIFKAPLTGTIQNVTIHRGQPIPAFTFTWSGFVNGDTAATAVTGTPVLSTTATSSSPVGRYLITGALGTLQSHNYNFIAVNGILTILP